MNTSNVLLPPTDGVLNLRVREGEDMDACDFSGAEIKSFGINDLNNLFRDWKVPPNSYTEVRVKIPQCDGVGAAFWLYGATGNRYYEIDVFEHDSDEPNRMKSNVHFGMLEGADNMNLQIKPICDLSGNPIYLSDQFLTFGVELTDLSAKLYLNDVIIQNYQFSNGTTPNNPFNRPVPFNIRLSNGGNAHGTDPSGCENLPQNFEIDYVRVYQKAGKRAVNFMEHSGKITLCVDNTCHGNYQYCNWIPVNYYPGATYEWEYSPHFEITDTSGASEDVERFTVKVNSGTPPGDYQLKLTVSFPCSDYEEELILHVKVVNDPPSAPYYISLFTSDDYHYYPGTTIDGNSTSYEWYSHPIFKEVPNPTVGNRNIWSRYFRASYEPRDIVVCARAKGACGVSSWHCQTLTIPAIEDPCSPCPRALLPPHEVLVEQIPNAEAYRLKVSKSPYSQSYEWSFDETLWHNIANIENDSFNYFGAFEPNLDSFLIFVRGKNQDTLSSVYSQMVATPDTNSLSRFTSTNEPISALGENFSFRESGVNLSPKFESDESFMVFNTIGQMVWHGKWDSSSFYELRENLSPGLYVLVKMSKDLNNRSATKFLITK